MKHALALLAMWALVMALLLLAGCSSTQFELVKPDGTTVTVYRTAFLQDLDGNYEDEQAGRTVRIRLKSNPNIEAFQAGMDAAKEFRP